MPKLYLIRHGEAEAGFDAALDPGLSPRGQTQAEETAARLESVGPLPLFTSPLRRARETIAPFERRWRLCARVEPRIAEIPSPMEDPAARGRWLDKVITGRWSDLDDDLRRWRDGVLESFLSLLSDTVVVSHFIAINLAVGAATGSDQVLVFRPDHCSCTVVEVEGGRLRLIARGAEGRARFR
jgi:broad specificity phosphatase PhoE